MQLVARHSPLVEAVCFLEGSGFAIVESLWGSM